MTEKLSITKLQGAESYAAWSADLRLILHHGKNWSLAEGIDTKPLPTHIPDLSFTPPLHGTTTIEPPMVPNPDYEKWLDRSIDVLYKIQLTCEEVVKRHIHHLEVTATVWQTLHDLYEPKGMSMQSMLIKRIFCTTLTDYASIAEYLAAVETGTADYIC